MLFTAKRITVTIVALAAAVTLFAFRPQPFHFSSEYQYVLYLSWLHRGGFAEEGPARLSQYNIAITFENRKTGQKVAAEFDMEKEKIAYQIERVTDVTTTADQIERSSRYYLEQLIFRLNTVNTIFVTDFIEAIDIELLYGEYDDMESIAGFLQSDEVEGRLTVTAASFDKLPDGRYFYDLWFNNRYNLKVIFNQIDSLSRLARSLKEIESRQERVRDLQFPARKEFTHYEIPPAYIHTLAPTPTPSFPAAVPKVEPPLPVSVRDLRMVDYIKTYYKHNWGRELLHNKIENRERFIKEEFPYHKYSERKDEIKLTTDKFKGHFSANLKLVERQLRDGILFSSSSDYRLDDSKNVTLATGEQLSLSELTSEEIDIIAPYMNQLVAMHRVMGTKMLNFLIIPAEVPTILVIRDPDREVIPLDSYTDLILMFSYYWADRNIYFNIDSVKKINNYVELSGTLVAHRSGEELFDYAEVLFSLDKNQRIDVAMVILHTNVEVDE